MEYLMINGVKIPVKRINDFTEVKAADIENKDNLYVPCYDVDELGNEKTKFITTSELETLIGGGGLSHSHAEIKDTAGTTYIECDEVAGVIKGKSTKTGTDDIFQLFEGTATPVKAFHIDGNGNILKNGSFFVNKTGTAVHIGNGTTDVTGNNHVYIGHGAGTDNTLATRYGNTAIGYVALYKNASSYSYKTAIGYFSGYDSYAANQTFVGASSGQAAGGANLTAVGYFSGKDSTSAGAFFGAYAGKGFTGDTYIVIDPLDRTDMAGGKLNALFWGAPNATKANQTAQINGALRTFGRRKAQATKIADYTVTAIDECFLIDNTSTGADGTLPAITADNNGQEYEFKVINFANVCTLVTTGTDVFEDGTGTYTFSALNEILVLRADNTPATKVWRKWN